MTVSSIASIAAGLSRATTGNQSAKASALLSSLVPPAKTDTADFSALTATVTLQSQASQLRIAAQNVAQSSSLLDAADAGASGVLTGLTRLTELAQKASSSTLSDKERGELVAEFNAVRQRIDRIANSTSFNNEKLLDGSSPQLKVANENSELKNLSIGSLKEAALFKGLDPQITTPVAAKSVEAVLKEAVAYANQQLENIRALEKGLDFASATLQSAIQNNDAARSTLSDVDLVSQLLGGSGAKSEDAASLLAQTNKMPNNILQLLSE